tara:strand:+ start:259 stop:426 length:168 start_codon:yes stop_codon:yes gene_type:complete
MPSGIGTYGSKMGRPKKKREQKMDGDMMMKPRKKKSMGDRMTYGDGGLVDFKNPN